MIDVDVRISSHLKEELAWAVGTVSGCQQYKTTKELKETSCFKFKTIVYKLLCGPQ